MEQDCAYRDQILGSEPVTITDSVIDQTLGGDELVVDQTLTEENKIGKIEDRDLGSEFVQSGEETSSGSDFKSVNSLVEEEFGSAMSRDAESPAKVDDVDSSDGEDCYMIGMPHHIWLQRRRFLYEPHFHGHHMWDMHHGSYPYQFLSNPISFWSPMGIEKESGEEANNFSLFLSNLNEISPAMVVSWIQ